MPCNPAFVVVVVVNHHPFKKNFYMDVRWNGNIFIHPFLSPTSMISNPTSLALWRNETTTCKKKHLNLPKSIPLPASFLHFACLGGGVTASSSYSSSIPRFISFERVDPTPYTIHTKKMTTKIEWNHDGGIPHLLVEWGEFTIGPEKRTLNETRKAFISISQDSQCIRRNPRTPIWHDGLWTN